MTVIRPLTRAPRKVTGSPLPAARTARETPNPERVRAVKQLHSVGVNLNQALRKGQIVDAGLLRAVSDEKGTPLGDPIHKGDLGTRYAEAAIEQQIAANLKAMLADRADLVALHRAGYGGAAPSFRYRPGSALAGRTNAKAALENQKAALRESIELLHERQRAEQQHLHSILHRQKEAEMKLYEIDRKTRQLVAQAQQAQKTIDQEQRIRERDTRRRGVIPSPREADAPEQENGPEFASAHRASLALAAPEARGCGECEEHESHDHSVSARRAEIKPRTV